MSDRPAACQCGEQWFELRREGAPGLVAVTEAGVVSGYAGVLLCGSCGTEYVAPRQRLTVVPSL